MAGVNDVLHWRNRQLVREFRHSTDRVELDEETKALIAKLLARIEALEDFATAQVELAGPALRAMYLAMQMSQERIDKLEVEAADTHRVVSTVLPSLAARG